MQVRVLHVQFRYPIIRPTSRRRATIRIAIQWTNMTRKKSQSKFFSIFSSTSSSCSFFSVFVFVCMHVYLFWMAFLHSPGQITKQAARKKAREKRRKKSKNKNCELPFEARADDFKLRSMRWNSTATLFKVDEISRVAFKQNERKKEKNNHSAKPVCECQKHSSMLRRVVHE